MKGWREGWARERERERERKREKKRTIERMFKSKEKCESVQLYCIRFKEGGVRYATVGI